MKLAAIFSLTAAIIYIIFEAMHPAYYMHLYPDVFAFYARASFFWENLNLTNLGYNEYQPGAIAFFISLSPVFFMDQSIESFKWVLFSANVFFLFLIAAVLMKMRKTSGIFLMSIFLVFLGPILLFRFDLLVILLTIFSFYLWERRKKEISMIVLAFAVITKVYPIIFLPYLLFQNFKHGKKFESLYLLFTFSASFLALLLAYTYFFQISLSETINSYNFHSYKSVATESIWASVIYFYHLILGFPLPGMESAYGINAIARKEVLPSIQFYNYFWIFPLGFFYLVYFFKNKQSFSLNKHWEKIDYTFLIFILLLFLVFSKVLSNQYLAWFLFMLPLLDTKTLLRKTWIINIFLVILTTILHTYIYPLNYTAWLAVLAEQKFDPVLFWTVIISNFLLILLGVRIGIDVYKSKK